MTTVALAIAAGLMGLALLIGVLWFKRRRTPYPKLDNRRIPPVEDILPVLSGVTKGAVYRGNKVSVLQNGALFPAMLRDLETAEHSVHLETFVWSAGRLERQLVDALCRKADQGVAVRVLIDAIGSSKASREQLQRLRDSRVALTVYCRPKFYNWHRFNQRTHRKLFIVDGRVGYSFGHGVADQWLGDAQDTEHWRDTGVRLEGPVVHGLQTVFAENWTEETEELLATEACFPALSASGDVDAHVVSSASGDALSAVSIVYTVALAAARREVLIQNPYFVPDFRVVQLLAEKVRQGVDVQLMVPGTSTDSPIVRRAGCRLYEPLLQAGVKIYEYRRTLNHQKIMIVDGLWSHVGSTNFDARSLELNEEVSVGLIDRATAEELRTAYYDDLKHCRELTLDRWRERPRLTQLWETLVYQLHSQL